MVHLVVILGGVKLHCFGGIEVCDAFLDRALLLHFNGACSPFTHSHTSAAVVTKSKARRP